MLFVRAVAALLALCSVVVAKQTHAENARWIAHNLTYGVLSTTSVQFDGVAFGNPQSFVDGTKENSTGHMYLYVAHLDASIIDISKNPECTFTLSQEMINGYCTKADLDPEDPICMRVVMVATMENVTNATAAYGKAALFERHPGMKQWPDDHSFYVVTLKLKQLWIIDAFGGAGKVTPEEYYAAKPIAPPPPSTPWPRNGTYPGPDSHKAPLFTEKAKTARWMAHNLDFGVMSTTSTNDDYKGVAFGNPQSFADGDDGHLYFYMTAMDASGTDLIENKKASWALSEQMLSSYCTKKNIDPEDPRCARCVFTGTVRNATATESISGKAVLFKKHPEMTLWPGDHSFTVYTMDIEHIWLINMFGGASNIKASEYYKAKP